MRGLPSPPSLVLARGRGPGHNTLLLGDSRVVQAAIALGMCAIVGLLIPQGGVAPTIVIAGLLVACMLPVFVSLAQRGQTLPIWLVAGVVAYPFLRYPHPSGTVLTFDRVWIIAGFLYVALQGRQSARDPVTRLLFWSLMVFIAAYGARAATTYTSEASNARSALGVWFDAIVLPVLLFTMARRAAARPLLVNRILIAAMLGGVIVAVLGIAEHFSGFSLASYSGGTPRADVAIGTIRVSGPYQVPEIYGLVLVLSLAATMMWLQLRRSLFVGSTAAAVLCVGIYLSYFRSAWIAAALVLVGSVGIRRRRYGRLLVAALVAGVVGYIAFGQLEGSSTTFATRATNTTNINGRLATYKTAYKLFKTAPLFGVGVNQYPDAVNRVLPASVSGVQAVPFAHSSYLGVLAEQGVVGFFALMAVTIAAVRLIHRLGQLARSRLDVLLTTTLVVAGVGYLIMGLTLDMLPYSPSNGFFMVLLGLGAGRVEWLVSANEATDEGVRNR
jgi:O-antigen ligase